LFKAEGAAQMQWFLAQQSQARSLPAPGHLLPGKSTENLGLVTQSHPQGADLVAAGDGFFYGLLQKTQEL
jgi:16S rRNA (cytosine967-C5)-methyltransferase